MMQSTAATQESFHSSWLILRVLAVVSLETVQAPNGSILIRYVIIIIGITEKSQKLGKTS